MPKCLVKGCRHKTGNKSIQPDVHLHMFPKELEQIKEWLQKTGHDFDHFEEFAQNVMEDRKGSKYRICSAHFQEESYMMKGSRKVLKESAVPEVNLVLQSTVKERIFSKGRRKRIRQHQEALAQVEAFAKSARRVETRDGTTQTDDILAVKQEIQMGEHIEAQKIPSNDVYHHKPTSKFQTVGSTLTKHTHTGTSHSRHSPSGTPMTPSKEEVRPDEEMKVQVEDVSPFQLIMYPNEKVPNNEDTMESSDEDDEPDSSSFRDRSAISDLGIMSEADVVQDRKFIVFESCLDVLFKKLFCGARVGCFARVSKFTKHVRGTFLSVTGYCRAGHSFVLWESQPRLKNVAAGNILFSSSILFSGSNFQKVEEMNRLFGVQQISESAYHKHQRQYLFPTIHHGWQLERNRVKESLKGKAVCLGGDGLCDAPDSVRKYCAYVMMDVEKKKIVHFEVTPIGPGSTSIAAKKKAFQVCLDRVKEGGVNVHIVATDHLASLRKIMRDKYPDLKHQISMWHCAKRLRRRLIAASKEKLCQDIHVWTDPIVKHFHWSVKTCKNDKVLLLEKWLSVLNHVADIHEWDHAGRYQRCAHGQLTAEQRKRTSWMKTNSRAYSTLHDIVQSSRLTKDLVHMAKFGHTGAFESFHNHMRKFRPNGTACGPDSMYARTALAVLAHNNNAGGEQAVVFGEKSDCDVVGTKRRKLLPGKSKERWSARKGNESTSISHLEGILINVIRVCDGLLVPDSISPSQPESLNLPKPVKSTAVDRHGPGFVGIRADGKYIQDSLTIKCSH